MRSGAACCLQSVEQLSRIWNSNMAEAVVSLSLTNLEWFQIESSFAWSRRVPCSSLRSADWWSRKLWLPCHLTQVSPAPSASDANKLQKEKLSSSVEALRDRAAHQRAAALSVCGRSSCVFHILFYYHFPHEMARIRKKSEVHDFEVRTYFVIAAALCAVWGLDPGFLLLNNFPALGSFCMSAWIKVAAGTAGGRLIERWAVIALLVGQLLASNLF